MTYAEKKAKYAWELYQKGLPFKKVYAAVEKGDKFVVLKHESLNYKYSLSGGGVDDGEDSITAIKRELLEELNMHVEVVRSLGSITYPSTRKYQDVEFELPCVAEIFYTKFVRYGDHHKIGLDGEFDKKKVEVAEISKEEMLASVAEFTKFGIKL